ncbi:TEL2-interacting protein 1 [Madurella mycetomatis]|uniref:TEL2-interacting protein 1 n=1 Tax=Madurella mycetomatis TaxID=100816 RepID=A0A175W7E1_9PEZI|nr:TEL2-interacting protein 1 [Madurella mycetomatis]
MTTVVPSTQRNEFFQQLKRLCVPLSQLALRPKDKPVDAREVLELLDSLIRLWTAQANEDGSILDDTIADYVFFPLSHLLRDRDRYPVRVIEVIICLLRELIQHGWKAKASPQLFQQLLVFLSFTIGGAPGRPNRPDLPEEVMIEGFRTLTALIRIARPSHLAASIIPALGHSITVMLDGITESVVPSIQVEAVHCLEAVFTTVRDNTVLAQFLPGTVSALTKVLSPPLARQTQRRVLLGCLGALRLALINVLGDLKVRGILKSLENSSGSKEKHASEPVDSEAPGELTSAWLKATAGQVKIALSAVLKLRAHESEDIQSALHRLCICLLDECHASLADCQPILVESAMMLEDGDVTSSRLQTSLQDLADVYPEVRENVRTGLHNWITSLPRVMQSNDERVRQLAIRSILRGSKLAAALHMDQSNLDYALGTSLRDSIITLIKASKPPKISDELIGVDMSTGSSLAKPEIELATYNPVLLDSEGHKTTRNEVKTLISSIGSSVQQVELASLMLGHIRDSEGVDRIASFWLAFELLKSSYAQSSDLNDLLDLSSLGESKSQDQAFQELYDFSASVLTAHADSMENDWQLEAIALEVTAFAASRLKLDFRPELIDVLYPVTTFLGSQVPQLRRHAITTLNILAASCGYESVSELIVDNADYMVNSISLQLDTSDISPTSTKVLAMVIRLTGPKLIPYLDDTIASIFSALDAYHGYPAFVESLFSVLSEVVAQGVKSDMLLLEDGKSIPVDHRKKKPESKGIPGILQTLEKHLDRTKRSKEDEVNLTTTAHLSHPKKPWGLDKDKAQEKSEAAALLDTLQNPPADPNEPSPDEQPNQIEKPRPPTPTYHLLTRILSHTQHHLTSPTPTLRKSLLDMVAAVSPALAPDEDAFLPLVHAVWPVVLARLRDPEPYVSAAACRALAGLCAAAGDFLGARFKTEWWAGSGSGDGAGGGGMRGWVKRVKREAEAAVGKRKRGPGGMGKGMGAVGSSVSGVGGGSTEEILIPVRSRVGVGGGAGGDGNEGVMVIRSSSPSASRSTEGPAALGRFAQASQVWEAVLGLLTAVVAHVRVDDDMFDDILGLVVDVLPRHEELKEALETVNGDAVWLAMYERGLIEVEGREVPVVEGLGFQFVRMDGMGTIKVGA